MTFCHECGKAVVPPSAKFCRNCGAPQYEETQLPITPAATPIAESVREPLPVAGNTSPLPLSLQSDLPSQIPPEPVIPMVCKSCNTPINPDEKYCGICGSPRGEHDIRCPINKKHLRQSLPEYAPCVVLHFLKRENSVAYAVRVQIVLHNPKHKFPRQKLIYLLLNNPFNLPQ